MHSIDSYNTINERELLTDIQEGKPLTDTPEGITLEQGSGFATLTASPDEDTTPVSEQATEKKQRRKRTKKAEEDAETVQNMAEPVSEQIQVNDTPAPTETKCNTDVPAKQFKTGSSVELRLALLYGSSAAPKHFKGIHGKFYIWSSDVVNGRIRLTDSLSGVGKPERIIGWVKTKCI